MEFDVLGEYEDAGYKLLAGVIVPRPIAWVTTLNDDGSVNAAPFSFFNLLGASPPIVGFAPGDKEPGVPKDTARNIRRSGEFVVHLVDADHAQAMNVCASDLPAGESELALANLQTTPSQTIAVPRIASAPVAIECTEHSTLSIGQNRLIIGLIQHLYVADGILDPETLLVQREHYSPIGRMEVPASYCRTSDRFDMPRP